MKTLIIKLAVMLMASQVIPAFGVESSKAVPGGYPAVKLLTTGTDILGREIDYPDCKPLIKSLIITMAPGETGKTHQHLTPLYAYILTGKIQVSYQDTAQTTNTYSKGDAIMEAMHIDHYGFNPFNEPASLLTVYMDCETE